MSTIEKLRKGLVITLKFPDDLEFQVRLMSPFKLEKIKQELAKQLDFKVDDWATKYIEHYEPIANRILSEMMVEPKLAVEPDDTHITLEEIPLPIQNAIMEVGQGLNRDVIQNFRPEIETVSG